jgi:putative flippase GtrA
MRGDLGTAVGERLRAIASGVRFGQFVSVGLVGAACDTAVLVALTEGLGVLPEVATLVGIETAILVMFLINEHWTFADEGDGGTDPLLGRLKRSHVVRAGGVTTQFVVFVLVFRGLSRDVVLGDIGPWLALTRLLGVGPVASDLDVWLLVAKGSGIGVGMLVNYVFESLFTWRVHE